MHLIWVRAQVFIQVLVTERLLFNFSFGQLDPIILSVKSMYPIKNIIHNFKAFHNLIIERVIERG